MTYRRYQLPLRRRRLHIQIHLTQKSRHRHPCCLEKEKRLGYCLRLLAEERHSHQQYLLILPHQNLRFRQPLLH